MTPENFWARIDTSGGPDACWPWTGARTVGGYGQVGTSREYAHRIAYGPVPAGMLVLHRCDNPPCVNPAHLFLGTQADNVADMVAKGRSRKGERHSQAVLTETQVREIRRLRAAGATCQSLGAEYGVTPSNITAIATGRSWRHVA